MMNLKFVLSSIFATCLLLNVSKADECSKDGLGNEYCSKDSREEIPCFYEDPEEILFQWDPVEVSLLNN